MKPLSLKQYCLQHLRFGLPLPRRRRLPGPVILMYHGVVDRIRDRQLDRWAIPVRAFARHLDHLQAYYRVVPLRQIVEAVRAGDYPPDWVAITLDDGFANVFARARPLLRERGLPYAVAIVPGLLGTGRTVWPLELRLVLLRCRARTVRVPLGGQSEVLSLYGIRQRRQAADRLSERLGAVTDADRQGVLSALVEQLAPGELEEMMAARGELALMTAEQVRRLHAEGATIMAHGYFHARLTPAEAPEVLAREVAGARKALQDLVGATVDYFVYPHGADPAPARQLVHESGYRAGLGTRSACITPGTDLVSLPRIHAECDLAHLQHQLAQAGVRTRAG